jgi:predicted transcriptional regulator
MRYLDFISSIDDPSDGERHIDRIANPIKRDDRSYRGFNLCSRADRAMLIALLRGEGNITGITNKLIRSALPDKTSSQISYFLKRCWLHGLIRKCGKTYKYYLTKLGKRTIIAALKIHEYVTIPTLAAQSCS